MRISILLGLVLVIFSCNSESSSEGDVYFERGEYKNAITSYNSYLSFNPSHVKTIYNRGRSYEELGRFDEALQDYETVVKMDEKNVNARLSISKVKYEQGKYAQALLSAEESLSLKPNSASGHFLVARSKHQMGYTNSALESYGLAIKADHDFGDAYLYRGALKVAMDNRRSACEDFVRAKNLNVDGAENALTKYCR